ncbi:MAG: hypothetical protein K6D97_00600 [Clostridia bacterium]|nr:hypothetical protein [Clostridia bacterium]
MNILLITPNFFNYPQKMCEELRKMGHTVDWYDDRPSTNSFVKAIIRINKNYINSYINGYFKKIFSEIKEKQYDKCIIVSGQSLSLNKDMILKIKESQNNCEFVLYQWDSLKNFEYIKEMKDCFDRCYSFDSEDVKSNDYLSFLPLFYVDTYENIGKKTSKGQNYKYDCMFVGTAHPKKYKLISKISNELKDVYNNQFIYFFFPSRLVYIYRKIKNKEFKEAKYSDFNYVALKEDEISKIFADSKCILDSAQDNQNGLTIRVIETLGAKRKLITTNENIKQYDFYYPENIYVYEDDFDFNNIFFKTDYRELRKEIYEKYSLSNWLSTLING